MKRMAAERSPAVDERMKISSMGPPYTSEATKVAVEPRGRLLMMTLRTLAAVHRLASHSQMSELRNYTRFVPRLQFWPRVEEGLMFKILVH